ncbi:MerR family transcriptional regulator [Nocardioides sp. MH1]|uniref:MerR family transcriptional regulator n=1 Tax=Nocardioides sp. MH1 TaxID=3242490 RepID=UPI00352106D1
MTGDLPSVEAPAAATAVHIGEVAARTELSLRTLRHYDEVGLVRPSGRTEGGFRLYTEADIEKVLLIRRMKPLGFTLEEMAATLTDIESIGSPRRQHQRGSAAHERLADLLEETAGRRAKLVRQLAMADEFIDLLRSRLA